MNVQKNVNVQKHQHNQENCFWTEGECFKLHNSNTQNTKRTLKKRIRTSMFLCIFVTVLIFSTAAILLAAEVIRTESGVVCNYFGYSISQEMSSSYFLNQMGIDNLKNFNPASPKAEEWLQSLKESQQSRNVSDVNISKVEMPNKGFPPPELNHEKNVVKLDRPHHSLPPPGSLSKINFFFNPQTMVNIDIFLNDRIIYSTKNVPENNPPPLPPPLFRTFEMTQIKIVRELLNYFSYTCQVPLTDSANNEIGNVKVWVNPELILTGFMIASGSIILLGLCSLFIASLISKFLSLPITVPLKQLEQKIRTIALGDSESTINAQIVLKRPLQEIASLAASTNIIMQKTKEYNDLIISQKRVLENQNEELEAQNEELIESRRQIQEAQAMLVQTESMASIGQLTAAITHEINTPLGAVSSNVQICDMFINMLGQSNIIQSDEELSSLVTQMRDANSISIMACQRVSEIIKSLKTFSKLDQAECQVADIKEGIKSVLVLTSNLWKNKITMHEDYDNLPLLKCYPGLLNQVFMNLIVNAIQAIESKGEIFIKTYADEGFAYVSIRDTGTGIMEENVGRIFENGFTTKKAGIGLGMGLSICHNIVRKHKGEINVSSEWGNGTEFVVKIPISVE